MKEKSIKKNVLVNVIRVVLGKMFPLVTYPYITRVLMPAGLGRYDYSIAIVSYFQLIASLGITTYAIREGSKIKESKKRLSKFSNEVLLINIASTLLAYGMLLVCLTIFDLRKYNLLILIYSLTMFFYTIGVEWLYSIYEEFTYITVRSLFFQMVSLVLMFLFVRDRSDVWIYMLITVISSSGSNICNLLYIRKKIKLFQFRYIKLVELGKHMKPIMVIFGSQIASVIYLNMDKLMLGTICGDESVGLYSASVKFNSLLSGLITAVSGVMLPRLSYYLEKEKIEEFNILVKNVLKFFLFAITPSIIGLGLISERVIVVFCGEMYGEAYVTMKIMLFDLLFSLINGFVAYQVCIPHRKEKKVLWATSIGAVVNIVLNSLLIPLVAQNGAAMATLLSEIIVFVILILVTRNDVNYKIIISDYWQIIIACSAFCIIKFLMDMFELENILYIIVYILVGALLYILVLLLMKNYMLKKFINYINKFLRL